MKTIQTTVKDSLAIITLNRPKSNAINYEMMTELETMVDNIDKDPQIRGLMLSGHEGFFSAGLDLLELYHLDKEEVERFWSKFFSMTSRLLSFSKPMVAALTGHSPAGGCVLAMCADYRVMADGKFVIGLNEIPVGIAVPSFIAHLYSFWIGKRLSYQYLLEGKLLAPQEALQVGLVDEVVSPDVILTTAEKKARFYMAFEPNTWRSSKQNLREEILNKVATEKDEVLAQLLEQWFNPSTRAVMKAVIDSLQKK